jgi:holin-like protein
MSEAVLLASLTTIVLFEIAGDLVEKLTGVPVPGPVIGMALLLFALILKGQLPDGVERAASGILSYLPMLFVPAGVGVMTHFALIRADWLAVIAAIVGSSVLAISVTAWTMSAVEHAQKIVRYVPRSKIRHQQGVP